MSNDAVGMVHIYRKINIIIIIKFEHKVLKKGFVFFFNHNSLLKCDLWHEKMMIVPLSRFTRMMNSGSP